jgi:hypothetical protein
MRIVWDEVNSRFLAELTPGEQWSSDLESIKIAGFKTDGPPQWQWYTIKALTLNKLRDARPKSGITLTELALEKYKIINQREEEKAALKKQLKKAQTKAKRESRDPTVLDLIVLPEKGYVDVSDLPALEKQWIPPVFLKPDIYCIVCEDPLYLPFPDYPDICLWCSKVQQEK